MKIFRDNLTRFTVQSEDSLLNGLRKINENKLGIVFSTSSNGAVEGVITSGDFRRWLLDQKELDLNLPISHAFNKKFTYLEDGQTNVDTDVVFTEGVQYIPVLDAKKHLVGVATNKESGFIVSGRSVGMDAPVFIIAEIGINHNGDFAQARRLVHVAKKVGADCVKFQMRDMDSLYREPNGIGISAEDLGSQYVLDLVSRFQLSIEEMYQLFDLSKQVGLIPLCTPWDLASVASLEEYQIPAYKIASCDLTNHELIERIATIGKPIFCSTGMSTEEEIKQTIYLLGKHAVPYVLLHCNSTYPPPLHSINLNYLQRLSQIGACSVGYSGHEKGINVALGAVAKGACVIEKHITLDRSMEGNDHKVSLLPSEFKSMVQGIRELEKASGSDSAREISQGEMLNRIALAKSIVAKRDIEINEIIFREMVEIKSPGRGLQPNKLENLIGLTSKRCIHKGEFFFEGDLVLETVSPRHYHPTRPWGLPVRYHDYKVLRDLSNPSFLEFHLSYKDLDEDINDFVHSNESISLAVHSPDLFAGDHLLNFASDDVNYLEMSINNLQRVIAIAEDLKEKFRCPGPVPLIVSLGGFTKDTHILPKNRQSWYERVAESLDKINQDGVEILPQTLPPFPWYFGGQLYCNLFVDPSDTVEFCKKYGYRLCLDVAHSKLACNYFRWSFKEYVETVGPHIGHLHLVDSSGIDEEGLQIGDGDIDWPALIEDLDRLAPDVPFIPEIWQGHNNQGEGFWLAMERLEEYMVDRQIQTDLSNPND
jgi:N-acetylneuraminate synthase